jgi:hypothetical protein
LDNDVYEKTIMAREKTDLDAAKAQKMSFSPPRAISRAIGRRQSAGPGQPPPIS